MQNIIKFDKDLFVWFNSLIERNDIFDYSIKFFAVYLIYIVPVIILFFWFYKRNEKIQKFLLYLFITSLVSWQIIARAIGMIINRPRPSTFEGSKELLFHPPTYSFPSDHSLFLAFIVVSLYLAGYKKVANITVIVMISVSLSRVIAGFHWPLDVLAGWIIGALLAVFFYQFRKPIEKYFINSMHDIIKKLKLT